MNTENIYYTYYHFFPVTGQFYIGKGKGNRVFRTYGRNSDWLDAYSKNNGNILSCLLDQDLSEKDALDLERKIIEEFKLQGCKLLNKTTGGQSGTHSKEVRVKLKNILTEIFGKSVYCYQNGKTYKSETLAAEDLGLCQTAISLVCTKKSIQTLGYEFDFIENVKNFDIKPEPFNRTKGKAIKCNENQVVYKSVYDLCKKLGLHNSHVYRQLKGELKTVKGYTFSRCPQGKW